MNDGQRGILESNFHNFAKFGDSKSAGKHMTSKNFDKWLKESHVIDGKLIKSTDTDIAFSKILGKKPKGSNKSIEFQDLENVAGEIANHVALEAGKKKKDMTEDEKNGMKEDMLAGIIEKLANCSHPKVQNMGIINTDVVSRLTDSTKYTGTHKGRFDEHGKGKGLEGRIDKNETEGYVQGYNKSKLHHHATKNNGNDNGQQNHQILKNTV